MNLRIKTSIKGFFFDLKAFFRSLNWEWIEPEETEEYHWRNQDFEIQAIGRYSDSSINVIRYNLFIPGIVGLDGLDPIISFSHSFRIILPREYPARVDKVKIFVDSQLFHSRFSVSTGEACFTINGEIDRILLELIFFVLNDPAHVFPPEIYDEVDFGCNYNAMKWYQTNIPQRIFETLLKRWHPTTGLAISSIQSPKQEKITFNYQNSSKYSDKSSELPKIIDKPERNVHKKPGTNQKIKKKLSFKELVKAILFMAALTFVVLRIILDFI